MKAKEKLQDFFNKKVEEYNQPSFIVSDPICIPHLFTKKQDIEIAGFFAAIFAWGNRTTIINKSKELMQLMQMQPHLFCLNASAAKLKKLEGFKHRTFNTTDLLYCIEFFKQHYQQYDSLENAFMPDNKSPESIKEALSYFHHYFFSLEDAPLRTKKHISTPEKGSSCKRLNMFLRWMVRKDKAGVDFGIWKNIKPNELICPIDLHVARVAKRFNLLDRKQTDWLAAEELTNYLKKLDPKDPAKYDFALFGLGVIEKY
ncbi:TIGR02757 family protein [Sediminibacterium sp.]|uniref:TIGR02757 family protein n=1 Tax=Sediminibacterium sp. TaxID=1917865 RepID=UPI003F7046DA